MWPVIRLFWSICTFRTGPEAVPKVTVFFALAFVVNVIVSLTLLTLYSRLTLVSFLPMLASSYLLLCLVVYALLWFKQRLYLYQGTLTAFFGADILIKLLLLPLVLINLQLPETVGMKGLVELAILLISLWGLFVEGFIYHRAAQVSYLLGIVISLAVTAIVFTAENQLFSLHSERTHSIESQQGL